jgi:uncharacterized protein YkwD
LPREHGSWVGGTSQSTQEAAVSAKVLTAVVALLVTAVLAPAAVAAERKRGAVQECADADLVPAADNLDRVRAAVLCLHNQVRARNGVPSLRENARLRRAAVGHSRAMVSQGFFGHTTPAGVSMTDRIMRARYARRRQGWSIGENLAWGTSSLSTARGAMDAWLSSPGHRANLLDRSYRELGVGVVLGVPVSDAGGATYTVNFGVRR